jgi:hypothetical protein
MNVESWEDVTPAVDVMTTRTPAGGRTAGMMVARVDLSRVG